jgi:hypothetical protein
MIKKNILAGLSILVAASLLVSACSAQQATPSAAPTIDANAIYTQAAQTVEAGQTMTQAAKPPTQTVTPTVQESTATMDANMAAGLTATANAVLQPGASGTATQTTQPGQPTATQGAITPLVLPTATTKAIVQPAVATGDKCEWVSNSPVDNQKIQKNASFDTSIKVKNTGTTTWDKTYALRFYAGERMGAPTDFFVQRSVKPAAVYEFNFSMTAPSSTGKKEILFVVQNPDGRNMCFINIPLEITD